MSTTRGGTRRCCALQIAVLLLDATVPLRGQAAPADPTTREVAGVPSDQELEALGAVIGDIYVNNENIFNLDNPADNTALFRLANRLHVHTRAGVIRNELLFRPGDRYSRRQLDETERILRGNQYFYDAWILPVSYHDGRVDLRITTRDVWTLDPGFNYGRSGGANSTGAQLEEINLLGTGTFAIVGHKTDVDRSQSSFGLSHNNIFGTWISASASYANRSDGMARQFTVQRPFYSLQTHWAAGFTNIAIDQTDNLYDRGQVIDQFHDHSRYGQVYAGWSSGLHDGWVHRWTVGWTYDEHLFGMLPSPVAQPSPEFPQNSLIPPDQRYVYPWARYDILQDDYVRAQNHDQIERTEDFYLGTQASLQLGYAARFWDSTRDALMVQATAGKGLGDINHTLLLLSAAFSGRVEDGDLHDGLLTAAIRYYVKLDSHWLFFTTISGSKGWKLDLNQQLLLGGDSGLRGYPLRYQDGTSLGLFTIEQRYFTDWYLFRLFRVGGAIFFDAGRTWGRPQLAAPGLGVLRDAGFGLRFGNARSGLGNIVHVDLAFPFDGDKRQIQRVQFLVQTESHF